jgi:hypothetical protein
VAWAVPALTMMFWVAAAILVVLFMLCSFVGEVGSWSRLLTGVALLAVVVSAVAFPANLLGDFP